MTILDFSSVAEKTCLCQEVILADGDMLIIDDHCRCREVLTRVNVWIVLRDKIKWPLWRGSC